MHLLQAMLRVGMLPAPAGEPSAAACRPAAPCTPQAHQFACCGITSCPNPLAGSLRHCVAR